jgi:hypothetical protein
VGLICDGELTEYTLHAISGALVRWSRALDEEFRRRPAHRRSREKIDSERDELARLTRRLDACRRWQLSLRAGGEPARMPLLLDECEEEDLCRVLAAAPADRPFPPLVRWLARVVLWLAGGRAMSRFLQAVSVLADRWDDFAPAEPLLKLERRLHVWKKRSRTEPAFAILTEMRHAGRASSAIGRRGKLSARPRKRSLPEHCDLLAASCRKLRGEHHAASWHRLPATLAAWAAADGGTAPLPPRMIAAGIYAKKGDQCERLLSALVEQFGQRAYDALLTAVEQLPELPVPFDIPWLRELLARGVRLDDLAWTAQHGQTWRMAEATVRPSVVRRIAERFACLGVALGEDEISELVQVLTTHRRLVLVERWIAWIAQFSSRTITPRLVRLLASAGRDLLLPAVGEESLHDCLCRWLDPPRCQNADAAGAGGPLGQWLRRTAAYQALGGEAVVTPPSVRKVLRPRGDTADVAGQSPRAIRAAQEALLSIALSALRTLLARRSEELWRAAAGCELPAGPLARAMNLARWIGKLDEPQRQLLREVGTAWTRHGGYTNSTCRKTRPGSLGCGPAAASHPPGCMRAVRREPSRDSR